MADNISYIVSVSITQTSRTPTQAGFGIPLALGYHTFFPELYRQYSDPSELVADGFPLYHAVYERVARAFAQNPRPEYAIVGRLPSAPAFVKTLTVLDATAGTKVEFKLKDSAGVWQQISYTILPAATTSTVATALELLVEATTGWDSTVASAVITATPSVAGFQLEIADVSDNLAIKETTAAAGYDTALAALQLVNDDWYFVTIDSSSEPNIDAVATWVLSQKKMFFANVIDTDLLQATGTIGSDLKTLANTRTVLLWTKNQHEAGALGWATYGAVRTPGAITYAFKEILGVSTKTLTTTQRLALEVDNINHYQTKRGLAITYPGVTTQGEWIDIIHGTDALEAAIDTAVFAALASSDKIPFTDAGMDVLRNVVLGAMKPFEGTEDKPGLLVPGTSVVTVPLAKNISAADRKLRKLQGANAIKFAADYSQALHFVGLAGTLSN